MDFNWAAFAIAFGITSAVIIIGAGLALIARKDN